MAYDIFPVKVNCFGKKRCMQVWPTFLLKLVRWFDDLCRLISVSLLIGSTRFMQDQCSDLCRAYLVIKRAHVLMNDIPFSKIEIPYH